MKTESALANAADKNLAEHPQDNDLRVFLSTLLPPKDLSLYKCVGKNSRRKRIRIWWRQDTVSAKSATTTLHGWLLSLDRKLVSGCNQVPGHAETPSGRTA